MILGCLAHTMVKKSLYDDDRKLYTTRLRTLLNTTA